VGVRSLAALVLLAGTTAVCSAQGIPSGMLKTDTMPPLPKVAATELQLKGFDQPSTRADVGYSFMSNKTRLYLSPGAPLQVVFTSPDGAVSLWFPDSGEVVRGKWHVEEKKWDMTENGVAIKTRYLVSICFNYSGGVPNIFGPEWRRSTRCMPLPGVQRYTADRRDGDVFGLANSGARKPLGAVNVRKLDEPARLQ
jgi:hypothetical protein